jgi:hypothetical protein
MQAIETNIPQPFFVCTHDGITAEVWPELETPGCYCVRVRYPDACEYLVEDIEHLKLALELAVAESMGNSPAYRSDRPEQDYEGPVAEWDDAF